MYLKKKDYTRKIENMFDISGINYNNSRSTLIEDIEVDVYYDINNLLSEKVHGLYKKDKFKCRENNINIIYPRYRFPEHKSSFKGPDSTRFLLSLYPFIEDLRKVENIILRPRYIEDEGTELVSLYIRREKIIVLYLHTPHSYHAEKFILCNNSRFIDSAIFGVETCILNTADENNRIIFQIPPLWYILSTIKLSDDDKIEKFFIKRDLDFNPGAIGKLSDISFQYSRLGY